MLIEYEIVKSLSTKIHEGRKCLGMSQSFVELDRLTYPCFLFISPLTGDYLHRGTLVGEDAHVDKGRVTCYDILSRGGPQCCLVNDQRES